MGGMGMGMGGMGMGMAQQPRMNVGGSGQPGGPEVRTEFLVLNEHAGHLIGKVCLPSRPRPQRSLIPPPEHPQ
jgi:hypothetical protein